MRRLAPQIASVFLATLLASASSVAGPVVAPARPPIPSTPAPASLSARMAVTVSEASLEYFVAQAARLSAGDNAKKLDQLAQQLASLKTQKQALIAKIIQLEGQIAGLETAATQGRGDPAKLQGLRDQLAATIAQLAAIDASIKTVLQQIERIKAEEDGMEAELRLAEAALARILASLESAADSDRAIWRGVLQTSKRAHVVRVRRALEQTRAARVRFVTPATSASARVVAPR